MVGQGAGIGLALSLPALNWLVVHYSWHWAFGVLGIAGLVWPIAWLLLGAEGKLDQAAPTLTPSLAASRQPARIPYRRLLFNGTVLAAYFAAFAHYCAVSVGLAWGTPFLVNALGYSQAAAGTIAGLMQRGAVLAVGTALMTSAGVLAPYVMGDIVEKAATPVEGLLQRLHDHRRDHVRGRPDRDTVHPAGTRSRGASPRRDASCVTHARSCSAACPEASKLRGRAENPYENLSETYRAVDDVPLASHFPAGSLQSRSAGKKLSLLLDENPSPKH
jgi:hypothetical protein